jgi:hypothetical protein
MCFVYVLLFVPYIVAMYFAIPLAASAAGMIYGVGIPACYVIGLFKVLALRPDNLPDKPAWYPERKDGQEPAVLGYFYGFRSPAFAEIHHVILVARSAAIDFARRGRNVLKSGFTGVIPGSRRSLPRIITIPLSVGAAVGMGAGIAFGTVAFVVIAAVHAVVATLVFLVMATIGQVLRLIDTGLLRIKNIRMVCPHCFERVPYPAYKCKSCAEMHKDVRPGRFGIFHRRCLCGTVLPTLLLFRLASSDKLDAYCPLDNCKQPLEHRPGEAQEIVLPFFGAADAGKTRLMYGIVALLRATRDLGTELADSATAASLNSVKEWLAPGVMTGKTLTELPRGQIVRVTSKNTPRLLQFYDTAGERFIAAETTEELRFLTKARTFILVIDPLSVESLWHSLPRKRQAELATIRSKPAGNDAVPSPELAYQQTHQQMEAMGVKLKKARLAVVFSRADVLDNLNGEPAEEWATDTLGLGNLIRSARLEFGETAFFRTASVISDSGNLHPSLTELTRWLVAPNGITLPETQNWMARA